MFNVLELRFFLSFDEGRPSFAALGRMARERTVLELSRLFGPFDLTAWGDAVFAAMWPEPYFGDWRRIDRAYREADRLELAVWADGWIAGLGLVSSHQAGLVIEFLEGNPTPDCPLRGALTLIALDAATNYAQLRNLHMLYVQPMNSGLIDHYKQFGFTDFPRNAGSPYLWKKV